MPLLVDHDDQHQIGHVREFVRMEDTTGPWIFGRAVVTTPPTWLKRGTPASFGSKILTRSSFDHYVVRDAIVYEISILSAAKRPAEPLAQVTLLERVNPASAPAARPSSSGRAASDVIHGDGQLIRRPGIGQVLRVR